MSGPCLGSVFPHQYSRVADVSGPVFSLDDPYYGGGWYAESTRLVAGDCGQVLCLGATESAIRAQFVIEAVLVSLISGVLGAAGGILVVYLVKGGLGVEVSHQTMSVSILQDLGFTLAIGVAAGLYPSRKASRLDIVTALGFE